MKNTVIVLMFLVFNASFGQSVNDYKYALVPAKFNFLKHKDEYRLNTLTKMLMKKYGFDAYLESDEMPDDMVNSNCNKIYVDLIDGGNFINTKLKVVLKDCKGTVLYSSGEGKSKEKDYKMAYSEAVRSAFESFAALTYKYRPKTTEVPAKNTVPQVVLNESFEDGSAVLFAQPISNGFQLVDNAPKVVMKIYKTSSGGSFVAVKGEQQGVLVLKDNDWFFEYYKDGNLVSQMVKVKF